MSSNQLTMKGADSPEVEILDSASVRMKLSRGSALPAGRRIVKTSFGSPRSIGWHSSWSRSRCFGPFTRRVPDASAQPQSSTKSGIVPLRIVWKEPEMKTRLQLEKPMSSAVHKPMGETTRR